MSSAARPVDLRMAMVDQLRDWCVVRTASVEAAMRTVPRHLFVPEASVERAYGQDPVVTHTDGDGVAISSASAPGVVAGMLEQLEVRPGDRVLEIGAGTGYNAALLAHMVGSAGSVTTVEYDETVADSARRALAEANCRDVRVICGDGEFGYADHAPYDRIVVTAGAWDIPPAWAEQLADGGRLVVPLRMRGITRSIAFERENGVWQSRTVEECGFIPMRGVGGVAERNIRIGGQRHDADAGVIVRIDDGQPVDAEALGAALDSPASVVWTGAQVPLGGFSSLDFWLASMPGFCRVLAMRAEEDGLVPPLFAWGSMGAYAAGTFAYLTTRSADRSGDSGDWAGEAFQDRQPVSELGVCAYGTDAAGLAHDVAERVRAWDRDGGPGSELRIEVIPKALGDAPDAQLVVEKRYTRVVVRST